MTNLTRQSSLLPLSLCSFPHFLSLPISISSSKPPTKIFIFGLVFVAGDKSRNLSRECVASVLEYMDPQEICKVVVFNKAFRGASYADFVFAALFSMAGEWWYLFVYLWFLFTILDINKISSMYLMKFWDRFFLFLFAGLKFIRFPEFISSSLFSRRGKHIGSCDKGCCHEPYFFYFLHKLSSSFYFWIVIAFRLFDKNSKRVCNHFWIAFTAVVATECWRNDESCGWEQERYKISEFGGFCFMFKGIL